MTVATFHAATGSWWRAWFQSTETFLLGAIGLMTLLGMTLYTSGPVKYIFWGLCLPVSLWVLVRRQGYRYLWANGLLRWVLALLFLYLMSITWSVPTTLEERLDTLVHTIVTFFFIVGLFWGLRSPAYHRLQFARLLILSCVIGGLIGLVVFYANHPVNVRLSSEIYLLNGAIKGPSVLLGCLIAAGLLMEDLNARHRLIWLVAGFMVAGTFTFMTQSRGALISFLCLSLLWGGYYLGTRKAAAIVVGLCAAAVVTVWAVPSLASAWYSHMATGLNGRIIIWTHTVQGFLEMPWLGHGAAAIFSTSASGEAIAAALYKVPHPHGLFFSMLFYFGVTGAVVLTGFLVMLTRKLWHHESKVKWLALFALFSLALLNAADLHTLVEEVDQQWWFGWLPILVMVMLVSDGQREKAEPGWSDGNLNS